MRLETLSEEGWRWICRSAAAAGARGEPLEESTEKEKASERAFFEQKDQILI